MPKVSVIVPIWNVEKYLPKCLDSLINQTLKDIEIICINDGSPDNCLNILKEYQAKDNRIIIIDQKNQGVSVARNKGLEIAKGEYIGFVDPDDWVDTNFYEELYNKAIEADADIVKGILEYNLKEKNYINNNYNIRIANNKFNFSSDFTSAIYLRKMLDENKIKFPKNIIIGEDSLFILENVYYSNKLVVILDSQKMYHYNRYNINSANYNRLDYKKVKSVVKFNKKKFEFINSKQISEENYLVIFTIIMDNLLEYNFKKCYDVCSKLKLINTSMLFFKKCKYKESFTKNYKKEYCNYLKNNDVKGFLKYLTSYSEYQTKYNLKLFDMISLFKIMECDSIKNSIIKRKFYILHIPILKIVKKNNKTYIKLFGFIPLFKIKKC